MTNSKLACIALVLALPRCVPEPSPAGPSAGSLAVPLSATIGADHYRVLGVINVRAADGGLAASVHAGEDSPPIETVSLPPAQYRTEIPPGYACSYSGPKLGFSGCTFIAAEPDPFQIVETATTVVMLRFVFHFEQEQDATVLLSPGMADFVLVPEDDVNEVCGSEPACRPEELCASLNGAPPVCYLECADDADCPGDTSCVELFSPEASGEPPVRLCLEASDDQQGDVSPPRLESLSFDPQVISTSTEAAQVEVSLSGSDDLSGFQRADVYFYSPSGVQWRSCTILDSTDEASFSSSCTLEFPAFSEGGDWTLTDVYLRDAVGNFGALTTAALEAAGFPTILTVESAQDVAAPVLEALSFDPVAIDTSTEAAQVEVSLSGSDDLSGFQRADVYFYSPSGVQWRSCTILDSTNEASFSSSCTLEFPAFSEGGDWTLTDVYLRDAVGNFGALTTAALEAAGFPTQLSVTSN